MTFKKPGLTPRDLVIMAFIGLVVLIMLIVLIGVNIGLSRTLRGGGEFFSAWYGARSALFGNADPYGAEVAQQSQQLAYGRPARADENPYILTVPFFLLPIYFPFALISDPIAARGVWMAISEAALVATAYLSLRLTEWQPRTLFVPAFLLLSVFSVYSVASLLTGSSIALIGLVYVSILSSLQNHVHVEDEWIGVLLVLVLFQWEVGLLFLLLIAIRLYSEKRSRVLIGFAMSLCILLIVSFLIIPGWLIPFLRASWNSVHAGFGVTSAAIFSHLWPEWGGRIALVTAGAVIVILGFEWAAARKADDGRFLWACCLTLAATPFLGFQYDPTKMVALFPSLALIFAAATERWRLRYWLTSLLYLIVLFLPWGFFVRGLIFQTQ